MNLTQIVISFLGNTRQYLQSVNQVITATERMAAQVTGHVTRMTGQVTGQLTRMASSMTATLGRTFASVTATTTRGMTTLLGRSGPLGIAAGMFSGGGGGGGLWSIAGGNLISHGIEMVVEKTWEAVKAAARLGAEYERAMVAFEVLTGDKHTGNKLFSDINQLGIKTPYTTRELQGEAQGLLGMGIPADQIISTLSRLGDIGAGDKDKLHRLTIAYGQVLAAGNFRGEELRQFTNAGIGVKDFAKTAGMGTAEFRQAMEKMKIPASIVTQTINDLTSAGGRFYEMNARINKTVAGSWSAMIESIELGLGKFGMALMQKFDVAGGLGKFTDFLQGLQDSIDKVVDWADRGAKALAPFRDMLTLMGETLSNAFSKGPELPKWEDMKETFTNIATVGAAAFQKLVDIITICRLQVEKLFSVFHSINLSKLSDFMEGLGLKNHEDPNKSSGDSFIDALFGGGKRADSMLADPKLIDNLAGALLPGAGNLGLFSTQNDARLQGFQARTAMGYMANATAGMAAAAAMRQKMAAFDLIKKWFGSDEGSGVGKIPIVKELDPEAAKFARDFKSKYLGLGKDTPLHHFQRDVDLIDKALGGATPGLGLFDAFGPITAMGSMGGMENFVQPNYEPGSFTSYTYANGRGGTFGQRPAPNAALGIASMLINAVPWKDIENQTKALTGAQGDEAMFRAFKDLEKATGNLETKLPEAMLKGSAAAQDTINRSAQGPKNIQEHIAQVLEEANRQAMERQRLQEITIDELKRLRESNPLLFAKRI